jgi:hypothetical protein
VETDHETFFVSVSIEKFDAGGRELIGISLDSPIYQQMQNKNVGDAFTYTNRKYRIEDIY